MGNIFNTDVWINEWEKDKQTDTYTVHRGFSTPEYWDRAAGTYNQDKKERLSRRIEKTLSFFKANGLLFKGMSVLEIGCGTGMVSLALAGKGAKVTALDFSTGMLEKFKEDITPDLKDNITVLHKDWHKTDIQENGWEKKFDLVIAFMSPGVASPKAFLKMMRCSKKGCAIRGWAAKKNHPIISDLWKKIMETALEDKPQSILYKINLLFSMGVFPEITFDTIEWDQSGSVDEEVDRQMTFFKKVSKKTDAELEKIIRPYLEGISENNQIVSTHKGLTATAVWNVDSPYSSNQFNLKI